MTSIIFLRRHTTLILFVAFMAMFCHAGSTQTSKAFDALEKYKKTQERRYRMDFQEYLAVAAEDGDSEAQYWYYMFSRQRPYKGLEYPDIQLSDSLAYCYIKKSAEQNYIPAVGEMGLLFLSSPSRAGIPQDRQKSFECLKKSTSLNDPAIDFRLGWHYVSMADSVMGVLPEALKCFEDARKHGDKDWHWPAQEAKAYVYFLQGLYGQSSKYYREWLTAYNKNLNFYKNRYEKPGKDIDYNLISSDIDVFVYAIESFIRIKDYNSLNLIPNYYNGQMFPNDKKVKFDFSTWKYGDSDYYAKTNLLNIIEERFIINGNGKSSFLRGLESLKLFYSLCTDMDANQCYSRSKFCHKINDFENELHFLNLGLEKGDFDCALTLGSYYYFGTEYVKVNYKRSFDVLKNIEHKLQGRKITGSQFAKGCYLLAKLYYTQESDGLDYGKSIGYAKEFLKAEDYSYHNARGEIYRLLALCYRFGRGVNIDEKQEQYWSQKAAEFGDPNEIKLLNWLNNNMENDDRNSDPVNKKLMNL